MNEMLVLFLLPAAGIVYCVVKKRPLGHYVGWAGAFLIILSINLNYVPSVPSVFQSLSLLAGIVLLVLACWDPMHWFAASRSRMKKKYPEYYAKENTSRFFARSGASGSSGSFRSGMPQDPPEADYPPAPAAGNSEEPVCGSLQEAYSRFFDAVRMYQKEGGTGYIVIHWGFFKGAQVEGTYRTNGPGSPIWLSKTDGFSSQGWGSEFHFCVKNVPYTEDELGAGLILSVLQERCPNAAVSEQSQSENHCFIKFQT